MSAPVQIGDSVRAVPAEAQRQRRCEVIAIQDRFRTLPVVGCKLTDADLYDEDGLPK